MAGQSELASFLVARGDDNGKTPPPAQTAKVNAIVFGVIFGLLGAGLLCTLVYFHLRRKRMDEREWPRNNEELDDYGFNAPSNVQKPAKARNTYATRPLDVDAEDETDLEASRPKQPSPRRSSKEELHDLARSISAKPSPPPQEPTKKDDMM